MIATTTKVVLRVQIMFFSCLHVLRDCEWVFPHNELPDQNRAQEGLKQEPHKLPSKSAVQKDVTRLNLPKYEVQMNVCRTRQRIMNVNKLSKQPIIPPRLQRTQLFC